MFLPRNIIFCGFTTDWSTYRRQNPCTFIHFRISGQARTARIQRLLYVYILQALFFSRKVSIYKRLNAISATNRYCSMLSFWNVKTSSFQARKTAHFRSFRQLQNDLKSLFQTGRRNGQKLPLNPVNTRIISYSQNHHKTAISYFNTMSYVNLDRCI